MKIFTRSSKSVDYSIVVAFFLLLGFGLIALASASSELGAARFDDSYHFLKHQILFGFIPGIILFLIASRVNYKIYKNSTGSTEVYSELATVQGNVFNYTDEGLTTNTTYYYVIVAYDAYMGGPSDSFVNMVSDTVTQDSATPKAPVRVRLKVDGFDWDYVKQHKRVVFLTPEECKNRLMAKKLEIQIAVSSPKIIIIKI